MISWTSEHWRSTLPLWNSKWLNWTQTACMVVCPRVDHRFRIACLSIAPISSWTIEIESQLTGTMSEIVLTLRCFTKIMMHALKYPHATVNGILIGEKRKRTAPSSPSKSENQDSSSPVRQPPSSYILVVDCVPLFHSGHGLTPMMEAALIQVRCSFNQTINYLSPHLIIALFLVTTILALILGVQLC